MRRYLSIQLKFTMILTVYCAVLSVKMANLYHLRLIIDAFFSLLQLIVENISVVPCLQRRKTEKECFVMNSLYFSTSFLQCIIPSKSDYSSNSVKSKNKTLDVSRLDSRNEIIKTASRIDNFWL
jgi:hypothetical protein